MPNNSDDSTPGTPSAPGSATKVPQLSGCQSGSAPGPTSPCPETDERIDRPATRFKPSHIVNIEVERHYPSSCGHQGCDKKQVTWFLLDNNSDYIPLCSEHARTFHEVRALYRLMGWV